MALIEPFAALRYDTRRAGPAERLCCPPYDVISEEKQRTMEAESPFNVIRLERPLGEGCYARAGETMRGWLAEGILRRDDRPAYYVCRMEFDDRGRRNAVHGFFARVRLEDFSSGVILPHEETLSRDKSDRFSLMESTRCNISPVYGLYGDKTREAEVALQSAMEAPPEVSFTDGDGVTHTLWALTDPYGTSRLTAALAPARVLIADGHHRYETALAFRDAAREKNPALPDTDPVNFIMMTLVDMAHPGLAVWPTHRLVRDVAGFSAEALLKRLSGTFYITRVVAPDMIEAELAARPRAVGLYAGGHEAYLLALRDDDALARALPHRSDAYRKLDVTLLHTLILEPFLGIDRDNLAAQKNLIYTRSLDEALGGVKAGAFQCAFLLAATPVESIGQVADAGERMPQKSTYFYPKLATGLAIHPLF